MTLVPNDCAFTSSVVEVFTEYLALFFVSFQATATPVANAITRSLSASATGKVVVE
jgi:hypothetical protein